MTNVYIANSVQDKISVQLNDSLSTHVLDHRTTTSKDSEVVALNCTAVQIPSGPNADKDKFGIAGDENHLRVQFETLEKDPQEYLVVTEGVSGHDLYFYVFEGTMVGQDSVGRSTGIHIRKIIDGTPVEVQPTPH